MKRTLQLFYWISGDPPSDSYELTIYTEDGQPLPTAAALQKTMVAANNRLAGVYLRMWKVSIHARNFDELLKHPLDLSNAILPPEGMDRYLKDPPIFEHISLIVQAVRKEKAGTTEHINLSKDLEFDVEDESMESLFSLVGNTTAAPEKRDPNRLRCPNCGVQNKTIAAKLAHRCPFKRIIYVKDRASGENLGTCHRLLFDNHLGCYDTECEFESIEERDILLHIQDVHNHGKEVVGDRHL